MAPIALYTFFVIGLLAVGLFFVVDGLWYLLKTLAFAFYLKGMARYFMWRQKRQLVSQKKHGL